MSVSRIILNALAALAGTRATGNGSGYTAAAGGIEGETLVSQVDGKYAARSKAKMLFIGSTALAGITIPVNASNLVSTFTLYNPLTSGVDCVIEKLQVGLSGTTTAVIGDIAFAWQNTAATTALATTTALANINNSYLGGAAPKALLYSAATYTGTPAVLENLGVSWGTTGDTPGPVVVHIDVDGSITVPPGYSITLVGNVAQTQPTGVTIKWTEKPV